VNVAEQPADGSVAPGPPSRIRAFLPLIAVSGGLLVLTVGTATWTTHRIEDDLTARSRQALASFGVPDTVKVRYEGLDAFLAGTVQHPQEAADAIGAVVGVNGTRHVTSDVTMATDAGPDVLPPAPTTTPSGRPSPAQGSGQGSTPQASATTGAPTNGPQLPAGKILFATSNATLSAEAEAYLDQVSTFLLANPQVRLAVRGHSDNSGPDEVNWALSKQRAEAVVAYLVSRQVPGTRLHPAAFAATVPVASNDTPDGRAANRRVELAIEESH
jgi:outer membrane protein OmpA-like peptidoglycan-associated protein